jgi:hypothetical protein
MLGSFSMIHPSRHVLGSNDAGISTEIYFPKKAAYQGAIFDALREGFFEKEVIGYLLANADFLVDELRDWSEILNPRKYAGAITTPAGRHTPEEARTRIAMYRSVFKGYSVYTVDGVFFSQETQTVYEEATQIVRLMFRFESELEGQAQETPYKDMVRSLIYWLVDYDVRLDQHYSWAAAEKERFLAEHRHWPASHLDFAARSFESLAKQVEKWIDDCGLFIFGFLVRKFSENVLKQNLSEEQIWVVSSFDTCVNVVKQKQAP